MVAQSNLVHCVEGKQRPFYFKEADFSTMRKIDNSSVLEMMKYDAHLLDTPRIFPTHLKTRFDELIARYISAEKRGIEEEIDYCLIQISNLLLGSTSNEDVRDYGFMNLHLAVQRYLRNPIYRSHTVHLLGVCLLSNLLLEADIDLLTLGRTKGHFFPALRVLNIPKPARVQDESKPTYYPGDVGSEMDRGVYPAGELFAVKLRMYLEANKRKGLRDAVCHFFDPFVWINLYHDWGYIYELEDSYSEQIYKNGKPPPVVAEIMKEINTKKNNVEEKSHFSLEKYLAGKNSEPKNTLRYILSLPLCFDESKEELKDRLVEIAMANLTRNHKDHGVVSSLILHDGFLNVFKGMKVSEYTPLDLMRYKVDFLKDELGAICLHNLDLREKGIRLRLTDSPHYFLLKFADAVSDWGRTYKGKISLYEFSVLEHIYFGFDPARCTKAGSDERYQEDERGILVNIVFDLSNNERLLTGEVGSESENSKSYPKRGHFEFQEFVEKGKELRSLDYSLKVCGQEYQWFFFNLVLIDRYGERFLLENTRNDVDLWWIIPPLFRGKFSGKEFSRYDYEHEKFQDEIE